MCSERILHVSTYEVILALDDPFPVPGERALAILFQAVSLLLIINAHQ